MKVINTNKNYWKKLSAVFTEYASKNDWNSNRSLKISHTSLFPVHTVGRGPNTGEPTLLDFSTRLIEANSLHFHYERRYGSIEIYYGAKNESPNNVFFEVRKNNKNLDFIYKMRADDENQFGWFIKKLCQKLEQKNEYVDEESIEKLLLSEGYSIVTKFEFSNKISFRMPHHGSGFIKPKYIKRFKNGIEIGWVSSGTYNSIPNVVRIEQIRNISTKNLSELGIETSGYYDHHYKCEILTSQAKQAKSFFQKRFGGAQ